MILLAVLVRLAALSPDVMVEWEMEAGGVVVETRMGPGGLAEPWVVPQGLAVRWRYRIVDPLDPLTGGPGAWGDWTPPAVYDPLPGDVDADCLVGLEDYLLLGQSWGAHCEAAP